MKDRFDRRFRLARVWSNQQLKQLGHLFSGDVVNASAGDDVDKEGATYKTYFPNCAGYYLTNFEPGSYRGFQGREGEFLLDLIDQLPEELVGRFEVVFNHTTLEHIFDVRTAFSNLCAMSRDVVIVVVPFSQVQHETDAFGDFWRFTPTCLRYLFKENGMEVVYEAANDDINAATYVLAVGAKNPEAWSGRLPEFTPLSEIAGWIGRGDLQFSRRSGFVRRVLSRIAGMWSR